MILICSWSCSQAKYRVSLEFPKNTIFFHHLLLFIHFFGQRLFDENLRAVDEGISKVVALFEGLFPDGKTSFIVTADHGMSNKGDNKNYNR